MSGSHFRLRPYREDDFEAVYRICLLTGDSGNDATDLYEDPHALGHLYAGPYVTLQPELAFVAEDDSGVAGYILGALDTVGFYKEFVARWLPPLQGEIPDPGGGATPWTPTDRIYHRLHHPRLHAPAQIGAYPSHLHINLLPGAQGQGLGRRLMDRLFSALQESGSPGVHLGVGESNIRAQGFYRGLGFAELERKPGSIFMGRRLRTGVKPE